MSQGRLQCLSVCYCEGIVRGMTYVIWSFVSFVLVMGVDARTALMIYSFELVIEG